MKSFKMWLSEDDTTEGGDIMIAMFVAQRILLGKADFKTSPNSLKPQVAEILRESGAEHLITE